MNINFIIAEDIQEAKQKGRMVQIKCKYCNNGYIGNHLSLIIDHLKSGLKLHNCPTCNAETKIHPEDLPKSNRILEIS